MKKLVLIIGLVALSFVSNAQNGVSQQFEAIWQKYRKAEGLPKANCNYQRFKVVHVTPNKIIPMRFITDGDTSYGDYVAGGTEKYIPKYHDKNIDLLFTISFNTKEWNGVVIQEKDMPKNWRSKQDFDPHEYTDSLNIQKLFDKIIQSELYGGIMLTERKFYVHFEAHIDDNFSGKTYTLNLYEVVDASALNLPADYGCTIWPAENIEELKPFMINPKTKKLLYPELSKKENKNK